MWAGWLDAKLVELSLEQAANAVTRRRFAEQWSESNPRFRACGVRKFGSASRSDIAGETAGGSGLDDQRCAGGARGVGAVG
jgi:hypothetical protein